MIPGGDDRRDRCPYCKIAETYARCRGATTAAVAVSTAVLVPVFQATADAASAYAVTAMIAVGNQAGGGSIAVDSDTHRGYVTSFNDSKLTVIDTGPNAAIGSIAVGSSPIGVALDTFPSQPSSPMVFVANFNGKSISFVDTTTDTVVGTVSLGNSLPTDMAVDPSTHKLYAVGQAGSSSLVSVVDDFHRSLTSTLAISGRLARVAVDSSAHKVYAAGGANLWEVDAAADRIASLTASGTTAVAANPATHRVYVTSDTGPTGTLSVIDESTGALIATVPVGKVPKGVAVDTSANVIYATNGADNTVSVIDGTTNTVTATVPTGRTPRAITVDPATHTAYVINLASNTVSVITRTVAGSVARVSGSDRFATAVAVSKTEFPTGGAGAVVLARGDDSPEALVGAPLPAATNPPLLLTTGAQLPAAIKAEIQRVLAPGGTIYVLGGTSAVPASICLLYTSPSPRD